MRNIHLNKLITAGLFTFSIIPLASADLIKATAPVTVTETQTEALKCTSYSGEPNCYIETTGSFTVTAKIPNTVFEDEGIYLADITEDTSLSINIGNLNLVEKTLKASNKHKLNTKGVTATWIENGEICKNYACGAKKVIKPVTTLTIDGKIKGNTTIKIIGKTLTTQSASGVDGYGYDLFAPACVDGKYLNGTDLTDMSIGNGYLKSTLTVTCKQKTKIVKKNGETYGLVTTTIKATN